MGFCFMERMTSVEKSAMRIRDLILQGKYIPGQLLPQRKVAVELGVSPIVVRESFRILEQEGMVECVPKWGAHVASFQFDKLKERYLLREALEGTAARIVSERIDARQISGLHEAADNVDRLFADPDSDVGELGATHSQFHNSIAELSGCKEIVDFLRRINNQQLVWITSRIVNVKKVVQPPSWHRMLVDSLAGHDPDEAEKAMRLHVRKGFEDIIDSLEKDWRKSSVC